MNYSGNKQSKSFYFDVLLPQHSPSQLFLLAALLTTFLLKLSYF